MPLKYHAPKFEMIPTFLICPRFGLLLVELMKIINLDETFSQEAHITDDILEEEYFVQEISLLSFTSHNDI